MKKSFVLIFTIFLSLLFSVYSLSILENNTIYSNLNKLKYLHLQAKIHIDYIIEQIKNTQDIDITNLTLNDDRFSLGIIEKNDENLTYYISIKTIDNTPIRLSEVITK